MRSLPPEIQTFLFRALLSASIGYLAVALIILRPTNWFGLAHRAWRHRLRHRFVASA